MGLCLYIYIGWSYNNLLLFRKSFSNNTTKETFEIFKNKLSHSSRSRWIDPLGLGTDWGERYDPVRDDTWRGSQVWFCFFPNLFSGLTFLQSQCKVQCIPGACINVTTVKNSGKNLNVWNFYPYRDLCFYQRMCAYLRYFWKGDNVAEKVETIWLLKQEMSKGVIA